MPVKRIDARRGEIVSIDEHAGTVRPIVALRELYDLLEAYSPMWYTQEAHDLARAALREQTIH